MAGLGGILLVLVQAAWAQTAPPPVDPMNRALVLQQEGRFAEAQEALEQGIALKEKMVPPDDASVAFGYRALALNSEKLGRLADATVAYEKAVAAAERLPPALSGMLAQMLFNQASFLHGWGRFDEARKAANRALAVRLGLFGPDHPKTADAHRLLGRIALDMRRSGDAEAEFRAIFEARARILPKRDLDAIAAEAAIENSFLMRRLKRYAEAEESTREANAIREQSTPRDEALITLCQLELGVIREEQGRAAEALAIYDEVLKLAERLRPDQQWLTARVLARQAAVWRGQRRLTEARTAAERALGIRDALLGKDHPDTVNALLEVALIAFAEGNKGEEEALLDEALARYDRNPAGRSRETAAIATFALGLAAQGRGEQSRAEALLKRTLLLWEQVDPGRADYIDRASRTLAFIYVAQKRIDDAEHFFRRAIAARTAVVGPDHIELARLWAELAGKLSEAGRYRAAEEPYRTALAIYGKHDDVIGLTATQLHFAYVLRAQARYAEAETLVREALALRQEKLAPDDPWIADALFNLGAVLRYQRRYREAEPLFRRSLAIRLAAYGIDHPLVLADLNSLALTLDGMGRAAEAEPMLVQVVAGRQKVLGPNHPDLADTLTSLIWLLRRQGRYAEAAEMAERPLEIYRNALGRDHPFVVRGLLPLATIHQERGEFAQADALFREALRIRTRAYGANHIYVADSYADLMRLSMARRQFDEAAGYMFKRLQILQSNFGEGDARLAPALADYANLEVMIGDLAAAAEVCKQILAISEKAYGPNSLQFAFASMSVARLNRMQGKLGNFESYYQRPVDILRSTLGPRHPWVAAALALMADFETALGHADAAEALHDEIISIVVEAFGPATPALAAPLNNKALLLEQLGRFDEAELLLKRAVDLLRKGAGADTIVTAQVLRNLGSLYDHRGRTEEALAAGRESLDIYKRLFGPDHLPPAMDGPLLAPPPEEL